MTVRDKGNTLAVKHTSSIRHSHIVRTQDRLTLEVYVFKAAQTVRTRSMCNARL